MNARVPVIRIEAELVNNTCRFKRIQNGVNVLGVGRVETPAEKYNE